MVNQEHVCPPSSNNQVVMIQHISKLEGLLKCNVRIQQHQDCVKLRAQKGSSQRGERVAKLLLGSDEVHDDFAFLSCLGNDDFTQFVKGQPNVICLSQNAMVNLALVAPNQGDTRISRFRLKAEAVSVAFFLIQKLTDIPYVLPLPSA